MEFDLILAGGTVVDGTGRQPYTADVGIRENRIAALGDLTGALTEKTLDARGRTVAPGFMDPHSHSDIVYTAPFAKQAELMRGRVCQGITTEIIGNCGFAAAPLCPKSRAAVQGMVGFISPEERVEWTWETTGDYLDYLETNGVVNNVGALVGHGPVRLLAMGRVEGRPANKDEIKVMQKAVRRSLDEGAFGLSFGLVYPPGQYAPTEEIVECCRAVAGTSAFAAFHQRGGTLESLLPSLEEILEAGRKTGASVHLSHDQIVASRDWERHAELDIALSERAVAEGLDYTQDMFPYVSVCTTMLGIYPPWALVGGLHAFLERLRDPALRARMRHDIESVAPEWPPWQEGGWPINIVRAVEWENVRVSFVTKERNKPFEGLSIPEIAAKVGKDNFDAISDLLLDEAGDIQQMVIGISGNLENETAMKTLMAHPSRAFCTDAWDTGMGKPHPGVYGAYPRILGKYVREERVLTLEEAVRKMTSLPAQRFGLADRGRVAPGLHADLVVFDPASVCDRSTYADPRQTPTGIAHVFINGRAVVQHGEYRPEPAGKVLRRNDHPVAISGKSRFLTSRRHKGGFS
jgi:N-acyl-D-amino-acid deacylase